MLCCAVLSCAVLGYAVLLCAALCCAMLRCGALCHLVVCYTLVFINVFIWLLFGGGGKAICSVAMAVYARSCDHFEFILEHVRTTNKRFQIWSGTGLEGLG